MVCDGNVLFFLLTFNTISASWLSEYSREKYSEKYMGYNWQRRVPTSLEPRTVWTQFRHRRLRWLGHVGSMDKNERKVFEMYSKEMKNRLVRTLRWKDQVDESLWKLGVTKFCENWRIIYIYIYIYTAAKYGRWK